MTTDPMDTSGTTPPHGPEWDLYLALMALANACRNGGRAFRDLSEAREGHQAKAAALYATTGSAGVLDHQDLTITPAHSAGLLRTVKDARESCEQARKALADGGAAGWDESTSPNSAGQRRSIELRAKLPALERALPVLELMATMPGVLADAEMETLASLGQWFASARDEFHAVSEAKGDARLANGSTEGSAPMLTHPALTPFHASPSPVADCVYLPAWVYELMRKRSNQYLHLTTIGARCALYTDLAEDSVWEYAVVRAAWERDKQATHPQGFRLNSIRVLDEWRTQILAVTPDSTRALAEARLGEVTARMREVFAAFDSSPQTIEVESNVSFRRLNYGPWYETRENLNRACWDVRRLCDLIQRDAAGCDPKPLDQLSAKPTPTKEYPDPTVAAVEDEAQPPALTASERKVLVALETLDPEILASAEVIADAMPRARRLSVRTIGPIVNKLIRLDLAERPGGQKLGARLKRNGRRLARKIADGLPDDFQ